MNPPHHHAPSDQPDFRVVELLGRLERRSLLFVDALAAGALLLWLLPEHWIDLDLSQWATRPVTALSLLLLADALRRAVPEARPHALRASQLACLMTLAINGVVLVRHVAGDAPGASAVSVAGLHPAFFSLSAWPSALTLCLSAVAILGMRRVRSVTARLVDAVDLGLAAIVLMMLSGFMFAATGWFGDAQAPLPPTQPLTLAALLLLAFIIVARRAQYGAHAVLIGIGIGSRVARTIMPYAIGLPFAFVFARAWVSERGVVSRAYATGISVTVQAMLFLAFIVWMATRINRLEGELRTMSLVDELTQVNNRRGFTLLAEQALRVAHRERLPATVFYFDLDGLKRINDTHGHDAGSAFIRSVAELLKAGFREGDVVARIGGDEFVVLAIDHAQPADATLARLDALSRRKIEAERLPYPLAFSSGYADVELDRPDALERALQVADERMYRHKAARRARPATDSPQSPPPA